MTASPSSPPPALQAGYLRDIAWRIVLFIISVLLFVLSLVLMKEGARPMTPLFRNMFSVDSPASALGFGWLGASIALSGSPVAATALSLLDANVLAPREAFAMVAGSRLGAAFIVLLIGLVYMLRGKQRDISLGVGLTSLLVTQTAYPAVLLVGFWLLGQEWLQKFQLQASQSLDSPFELLLAPVVELAKATLPEWGLFLAGFGLVIVSLRLFDKVIPELNIQETDLGFIHHLLYRPAVTFLLGAAVTTMTMSVSVSLSLLVPLSVRGFIRRENVIPYILGANITTFIDTLIAAAMLGNPAAVTVVMVQMVSVFFVSMLILGINYRLYQRVIEKMVLLIGKRKEHVFIYVALILGIPFILMWFG